MSAEVYSFPLDKDDSEGVLATKLPPGRKMFFLSFGEPQQLIYVKAHTETHETDVYLTTVEGIDTNKDSDDPTPYELEASVMVLDNLKARLAGSGENFSLPFVNEAGRSRMLVVRNMLDEGFMPVRN